MSEILLGYRIPTGEEVVIPVRHMCVTGQTQESGKTTTLEALIARSERRAIAFVTKRGERSFESGRKILPYFKERADWEFVESVIEAIMLQKMKFERAWIVRACKGAHTLADVRRNLTSLMAKSKRSMDQDLYMLLGEYLDKVLPLLARLPKANEIRLEPGLNVMDLRGYPDELQMLIISSSMRWVHQEEKDVITVLPEAWKFAPQGRNTPVKLEVRKIAREGAGLKNYIWVDSQDIAGVEKEILRAAAVWLLGVQREANEIERALSSIPKGIKRPKEGEIPNLRLGQFFACWGQHVEKVYVRPVWMTMSNAMRIAMGELSIDDCPPPAPKHEEENVDYKAAYEELLEKFERLEKRLATYESGERLAADINRRADEMSPKERAKADAAIKQIAAQVGSAGEVAMSLEVKKPVIDVTKRVYVIEASDEDNGGRLALLLAEGFFEDSKRLQDVGAEFRARGWMEQKAKNTNLNMAIAKLCEYGFLRIVGQATYQAVPGMEVNVKEVNVA